MNTADKILIIKASGEKEPFSEIKLKRSLQRAKTPPSAIEAIVKDIRDNLKPGTTTSEIYNRAYSLLKSHQRLLAARYSLKQAIMALGPSGHPFEKLVAELLKVQGYTVEIGTVVRGYCVQHEVDVVARRDNRHILVECKFHNEQGMKSDIKVALYVQARFDDIRKAWQTYKDHNHGYDETWLVTNTRLSLDAIQYANCMGMKTTGWNYPPNASLQQLIEQFGVYPITMLTNLSRNQKRQLIEQDVILCRNIEPGTLQAAGLSEIKASRVMNEIQALCQNR